MWGVGVFSMKRKALLEKGRSLSAQGGGWRRLQTGGT